MTTDSMDRARAALSDPQGRVCVLTGAGISAESGVPTFRGEGGWWREYRATDLATPQAFAADPTLVWDFYEYRRELVEPLEPNPAHHALVRLEERLADRYRLFTQNIDGLHHAAGSRQVIEIHGSLWRIRCTGCGQETENHDVPLPRSGEPPLPRCECGAPWRPAVVWFGEGLDPAHLGQAGDWAQGCEVFLVVGTSSVVYPAAGLAPAALQSGATVIEVNLDPTPLSDQVLSIQGRAGEVLPEILG